MTPLNRQLDDAIEGFSVSVLPVLNPIHCTRIHILTQVSLQLSTHRLHYESSLRIIALEMRSRKRHVEVLGVSRTSASERQVRINARCLTC